MLALLDLIRRYWYFFWSKSKRFDEINFLLSIEICIYGIDVHDGNEKVLEI